MAKFFDTLCWQVGELENPVTLQKFDNGVIYTANDANGGIVCRIVNRQFNNRRPVDSIFDASRNGIYVGDSLTPVVATPQEINKLMDSFNLRVKMNWATVKNMSAKAK